MENKWFLLFSLQLVLQSAGAGASVLQQLCTLPFPFYVDPRLSSLTLPALLAATHRNPEATAALSCELSYQASKLCYLLHISLHVNIFLFTYFLLFLVMKSTMKNKWWNKKKRESLSLRCFEVFHIFLFFYLPQLLEDYRASNEGKQHPLIRLLKDAPSPWHLGHRAIDEHD